LYAALYCAFGVISPFRAALPVCRDRIIIGAKIL